MLKKDPERHVRLMPARYIMNSELSESGQIAELGQKFKHQLNVMEMEDT